MIFNVMEGLEPMHNWLYGPERMALREACLYILMKDYGSELKEDGTPLYSTMSLYECAHDWVSQGNPSPEGIQLYYQKYYG